MASSMHSCCTGVRATSGVPCARGITRQVRGITHGRQALVVRATNEEEDVSVTEGLVRKGSKAKRAARKAKQAALLEGKPFSVNAPVRDAVQNAVASGKLTEAQVTEGQYITVLGLIFLLILIEGVFVAASGFLPEALDQFAQNVVYQAFSPTLILFLACSTAYGIWKTKDDPESLNDTF